MLNFKIRRLVMTNDNNEINTKEIEKLKKIIKRENIDGYIITKNDEFFGEYIPYYNDRLNFISDFTGSYGKLFSLRTISKLLF